MKQQTRIDNIADECNLWLNAVKQEEAGNLMEAHSLYLKDAVASLDQNSLVHAALSYSCAASCLKRAGKQAKAEKLYLETAKIYRQYVDTTKSLRERLWALLQAYDHVLLANDTTTLREIEKKYITIKLKVDPFSNEKKVIYSLRLRKDRIDVSRDSNFITYEKIEEKKPEQKEDILLI